MKSISWAAVGAVGTLLAGVAAVGALFMSDDKQSQASLPFYLDGCEQRMRAINLRAAARNANGLFGPGMTSSSDWCQCTAKALNANFDEATIREVGEWFQAVALGGAERSAEEEYFSTMQIADRRRVEAAYDFAARQCDKR